MADKTKDAKKDDARMSSIAKTLNKVEDRLEKSENCDSVAEGLANAAKASELLSSYGRCRRPSYCDSITTRRYRT